MLNTQKNEHHDFLLIELSPRNVNGETEAFSWENMYTLSVSVSFSTSEREKTLLSHK